MKAASAVVSSTRSRPASTTWQRGSDETSRPLPSFSSTITVPLSATRKLRAGDAHAGLEERRAQALARVRDQLLRVVRHRAAAVGREHLGDLAARAVDDRGEDVRGPLAGELDDPLAEVGLDGRQARRLEGVVELDLLGDHRLALGDHLHAAPARDLEDRAHGVVGGRRADHAAAAARDRLPRSGRAARARAPRRRVRIARARSTRCAQSGWRSSTAAAEPDQVAPRRLQRRASGACRRAPSRVRASSSLSPP